MTLKMIWNVAAVFPITALDNKCIGDDMKAAARQSPNCIKKPKNK